jgi:hypothetical protein
MTRAIIELHHRLSAEGRALLETCLHLVLATMVVSITGSVFALSSGWTPFGFGVGSALILPLLGYCALIAQSAFGVGVVGAFSGVAGITFVISSIIALSVSSGDVVGCLCDAVCADRLLPMNPTDFAGKWACRNLGLARTFFWLSLTLGAIMAWLQIALCWWSFRLSQRLTTDLWVADSETATFTPLMSPAAHLPPELERSTGATTAKMSQHFGEGDAALEQKAAG